MPTGNVHHSLPFFSALSASLAKRAVILLCLLALMGCPSSQQPTPGKTTAPPAVAPITFRDVTDSAGIRFQHTNGAFGQKWMPETMGGGGGFIDFDGDGWLDIVFVNSQYWTGHLPAGATQPTLALYRNNRDGTFTDVTRQAGLAISLYGMGLAVGDYDNDGYDDLFITAIPQSHLLHNVPDGRGGRKFVDVTASCGIRDTGWPTSAAWLDFDRDGKLDLFVCHYVDWTPEQEAQSTYSLDGTHKSYARPQNFRGQSCRLYHNLGNGQFVDVTQEAGIFSAASKALGVLVCDYDADGWPDLFVANDTQANFLFHNQGGGHFKEIAGEAGIALSGEGTPRAGMGIDAADITHTGLFDVLITNFSGEQLTLYRRDSAGLFLDVAAGSGVGIATQTYLGFGAFFFDCDNDGWADLFVNNGHIHDDVGTRDAGVTYAEPALLFRNLSGGRFADVSAQSGAALAVRRVGRAAAYGDYDNDGHLDILLMTNNGRAVLLHNESGAENGWIRLALRGTESNRDAIGARVRVTVGGQVQTQEVRSGSSYLAASDTRLLFGLGTASQADQVEIRWPNGKVQPLGPIQRGQTRVVTEGR